MKATNNNRIADSGAVSGGCHAAPTPPVDNCHNGYCVYVTGSDDSTDAVHAAQKADVSIVFVATSSSEGGDRGSLSFSKGGDQLVDAVVSATAGNTSKKVIVVGVTPGAVLTPWASNVSAILIPFMPGQEYGNAITDVLYGVVNPSARLHLTFPNKENEQEFTTSQWPGIQGSSPERQANYTEKAYFGYRWYDKNDIQPAFAFGHGLSYSDFKYTDIMYDANTKTVSATITNIGKVAGAEVAQLYLGLPTTGDLDFPEKQLKGFQKLVLEAGEASIVHFKLTDRDISGWNTANTAWTSVKGIVNVFVGASSRDIRLKTTFTV
jgi:beta-glucosidase